MRPAVYVVNLARATERMARLRAKLDDFAWDFHRIQAIDAREMDSADLAALAPYPWSKYQARYLTPGEICCLASHRIAWQQIVNDRVPWGLVLEDDALLGPNVPAALDVVDQQSFFDVIKLEGITTKRKKNVGIAVIEGPPTVYLMETVSAGAAACCVTRDGANKLLSITSQMNREADFYIRQYGMTGLVVGEVRPFPASQDRSDSYIGAGRQRMSKAKAWDRVVRTVVRSRESVARRLRFRQLAGARRASPVNMEGSSPDVFRTER